MANSYTGYGTRSQSTPQTEPIPGREADMAANNGGGFSFVIDDMTRFNRFLVIGTSGGSYYCGERKLTKQNLDALERLLKAGRGLEVVSKIVEISDAGRGVSNDPALFALARCCAADDKAVSRTAYDALPKVARIGTHLLHFVEYVKQFRGRGRQHRRAIKSWYNDKRAESLAYQVVKYQNRDGWSQRDVLRLARPKPVDNDHNAIYRWVTKGWETTEDTVPAEEALRLIWAFERAKHLTDANEVADLILKYRLPREAVPTASLNAVKVWEALLQDMPLEAMMRNLATMTKNGVLVPMGEMTRLVCSRLRSQEAIQKARLHPIKILVALKTYEKGKGIRGNATWTPVREVIDALNDAFYLAFKCVEPSNKRIILALDVSASMTWSEIGGNNSIGITPRVGSAAMALVTAASEPNYAIMAFSGGIVPVNISPRQRLDDVVRTIERLPASYTDCSLPMTWAMQNNMQVDAFVVYTDNETNTRTSIHPVQALANYRKQFGIPAKLVVVGMTATEFSIADPNDPNMLDCVGFSTDTPNVLSGFIKGEF